MLSLREVLPLGVALLAALWFVAGSGSAAPAGLVAAYAFDEGSGTSVTDSSGGGNTGTILNAAWSSSAKFGKALSFNGTSARVNIPDANSLDLTQRDDARGVGQPDGGAQQLARRHLQGQRQLLPGGVGHRQQAASAV